MIISIDAGKAFDKLWLPFMIKKRKNSPESRHIIGSLPQHNKGYIQQTHSKHHSQWWKTESISFKIRKETTMSALTTIIQHSFGSPSYGNQRGKKDESNTNWKRRSITVIVCRWPGYYT